jgi:pimeloyl-ACP methyl ester carboxylesterase
VGTVVLVHGSWHGGWCWNRLVPILRAAGHDVQTPTLRGLGDRLAEAGPDVGLSSHVAEVTALLGDLDLHDVVLVGASYGGAVITAVAAAVPERIRHLFFLDGLLPEAGQSCFDLMPGTREGFITAARSVGSSWAVPPPPPGFFGIVEPADAAWAAALLTPMPIKTHDEPVTTAAPMSIPGTYLRCDGFLGFDAQMGPAVHRGYRVLHASEGHDLQVIAPRALAAALLPLA